MKPLLVASLAALVLAGCTQYGQYGEPYDPYGYPPQGPQSYPYPAPYPTPYPGQQAGFQEPYRATGTEPFWSLTIDNREMRFEDAEGYSVVEPTPPVEPGYGGDLFRGRRITLEIVHQRCSDGMSDRIYPDRVNLTVDGRRLTGCGAPDSAYGSGWDEGAYTPYDQGIAIPLERTSWTVTAINGSATPPRDFYLNFFPDNRMDAKFGCNAINAGYQQSGERLTVGAQQMTRMACPAMQYETQGSNILSQPMDVRLAGDTLTLSNRAGSITARRVN